MAFIWSNYIQYYYIADNNLYIAHLILNLPNIYNIMNDNKDVWCIMVVHMKQSSQSDSLISLEKPGAAARQQSRGKWQDVDYTPNYNWI